MNHFFATVIRPFALERHYTRFCEIGASLGDNTRQLLTLNPSLITIIDPCLDVDLEAVFRHTPQVQVRRGMSLDELPKLGDHYDCILIDGDHNWYTVYNELRIIEERQLLRPGGAVFLHDIGWPYGRRDMYYRTDTIPQQFRHESAKLGIHRNQSKLVRVGGINDVVDNALLEGGSRNGVLTAVEDFMTAFPGKYHLLSSLEEHGLAIIVFGRGPSHQLNMATWWLRLKMLSLPWRRTVK